MPNPSYREIVELAIRLGEHDRFDKKWILYPAFATPPEGSKKALAMAVRYRKKAAAILKHEAQPPDWLMRELAPRQRRPYSREEEEELEELRRITPDLPGIMNLKELVRWGRHGIVPARLEPEPELKPVRHPPLRAECRRIRVWWPCAVLCLWHKFINRTSPRQAPVYCWRTPYRIESETDGPAPAPPVWPGGRWVERCTTTLTAAPYGREGANGRVSRRVVRLRSAVFFDK